jgi:hypothetical protein
MMAASILQARGYRNLPKLKEDLKQLQTDIPKSDFVCQTKVFPYIS